MAERQGGTYRPCQECQASKCDGCPYVAGRTRWYSRRERKAKKLRRVPASKIPVDLIMEDV